MGDKFHGREGKNPDRQLRSLNCAKWERMWNCTYNQEVGLEAATLKESVTAHWSSDFAPKI